MNDSENREKTPAGAADNDAASPVESATANENEHSSASEAVSKKEPAQSAENSQPEAGAGNVEKTESKAPQKSAQAAPEKGEPVFEDEEAPPSLCARVFTALAHAGPLVLALAICCMVWPEFAGFVQGYYCPAESRAITAFLHGANQNSWLAPMSLEGGAWIAQWPAYTWLLALLSQLCGMASLPGSLAFPAAAALCAIVAALGVWGLAHAARFGSKASFAAGIILLCAPLFAPLPHFVGASVLSAALLIFSLIFFCRGWIRPKAWISLPLAFICAGLAGLSGGLFYLILPLLASILFLIWRGSPRRGQGKDALLGFALLLILLGGWVAAVILLNAPQTYLSDIFREGLRISWPPHAGWWVAFILAGIGLLPWLLMVLGVSWVRVLAKSGQSLGASRHENGSAFIWISLVLGCLLAPFFSYSPAISIALACMAAPLLGKAFMRLPPIGNRFFFLLASLLLIFAGIIQLAASFQFSQQWLLAISPIQPGQAMAQMLLSLKALPILGGICLFGGLIALFVFARRDHGGGGLVFSLLLAIILCQPALLMLVPELAANPANRLLTLEDIGAQYKNASAQPASLPDQGAPQSPAPVESGAAPAPVDTQTAPVPAESPTEPVLEAAPQTGENPKPAETAPEPGKEDAAQPDKAPAESPAAQAQKPDENAAESAQPRAEDAAPANGAPAENPAPAEQAAQPEAKAPAGEQNAPAADEAQSVVPEEKKAEIAVEEVIIAVPENAAQPEANAPGTEKGKKAE